MTPAEKSLAQLDTARAVRDELKFRLDDGAALSEALFQLDGIARHYGLPGINGSALVRAGDAARELTIAIDAYDEFIASLVAKSGDPAPVNATAGAGEPVRAAA
jgi:hypothetical protein